MLVYKKCISIIFIMIACIYIIICLPMIPFVAPLGLLSTAYSNMTTVGAILCLLGTITIPLSMPVSSYFICVRLAEKKYLKAFFYCVVPVLCSLGALLWFFFIVSLHDIFFLIVAIFAP